MCEVIISNHAYERLKERNSWSKKAVDRMAGKIYETGITARDVKGYLKDWFLKKQLEAPSNTIHILYGDVAYVFQKSTREKAPILITAYPAPTKNAIERVRNGARRSDRTRAPLNSRKWCS